MTTYTAITDGQIDQDSPITQPLMTAMRDNPIAIAERATGAPYVENSWYPYNSTSVGNDDGLVYDHAVDGNISLLQLPALEAGYDYRIEIAGMRPEVYFSSYVAIEAYKETSGQWVEWAKSFDYTSGSFCYMRFDAYGPYTQSRFIHFGLRHYPATQTHADASVGWTPSYYGLGENTSQKISLLRVRAVNRINTGGKIYFYRRKDTTI